MSDKKKWYEKGLKFECQGSGKCCVSRGEYGFVYLDEKDRKRFAKYLKVSEKKFIENYCETTGGYFHLSFDSEHPECIFLKNNKCGVYEARPTQCRTWPFWPEVLEAKTWNKEVSGFCPGVGRGKTYSSQEIEIIAKEQSLSEALMDKEL